MEKAVNIRSGLWLFFVAVAICLGCVYLTHIFAGNNNYDTSFYFRLSTALSAITTSYLILMFMPLPVEQHWLDKVKIAAVLTFGAVAIGIFSWQAVAPNTESETVSFFCKCISVIDAAIILLASFATGAAAYYLGYPKGRYTALAAVPMGLGIWALRSGSMGTLLTYHNDIESHKLIYMSLRWEGVFWFLAVAAGYAGVRLAAKLCGEKEQQELIPKKKQQPGELALPLVVTSAIAWPLVIIFAQSPKIPTNQYGTVYSQPRQAQIAFALLASFGIAGYLVRRFMKVRVELPIISTVLFSLAAAIYSGKESIQSVNMNLPPYFFSSPIGAILPIQIIAFGTLGVLCGYAISTLSDQKKLLEKPADITP